jgi:hypothetical protein
MCGPQDLKIYSLGPRQNTSWPSLVYRNTWSEKLYTIILYRVNNNIFGTLVLLCPNPSTVSPRLTRLIRSEDFLAS